MRSDYGIGADVDGSIGITPRREIDHETSSICIVERALAAGRATLGEGIVRYSSAIRAEFLEERRAMLRLLSRKIRRRQKLRWDRSMLRDASSTACCFDNGAT